MDIEKLRTTGQYVLDSLRSAGADMAQCSVAEGESDELNADNNEWSLLRSVFNNGVSMKAIVDGRRGIISTNSFLKSDIDAAVADCIAAAKASDPDEAYTIASLTDNGSFFSGPRTMDRAGFFDRMEEYLSDIKSGWPKVCVEQLIADFSYEQGVLMNTNGVEFVTGAGEYDFGAMYSAHDGENTTSFNSFDLCTDNLDKRFIDLGMQRTMLDRCVLELGAAGGTPKFVGTAVLCPTCLSDFMGMAVDNFVSDGTLIDGTSPWKNSLGSKVASDGFTLSFAPLDARIVNGERVTDDGYRSEDYDVIRDGVLKSFCLSEYGARKTGLSRSKNTSGAMRIAPGCTGFDKMISGIDRGILVGRFSGGSPAVNGDFSGVAKNSFLIENGRITVPVTETMISGNIADMLRSVVCVSSECVCDGGSILPYAAFRGVTVS